MTNTPTLPAGSDLRLLPAPQPALIRLTRKAWSEGEPRQLAAEVVRPGLPAKTVLMLEISIPDLKATGRYRWARMAAAEAMLPLLAPSRAA